MRFNGLTGVSDYENYVVLLTAFGPVRILTLALEVLDCPVQLNHGAGIRVFS